MEHPERHHRVRVDQVGDLAQLDVVLVQQVQGHEALELAGAQHLGPHLLSDGPRPFGDRAAQRVDARGEAGLQDVDVDDPDGEHRDTRRVRDLDHVGERLLEGHRVDRDRVQMGKEPDLQGGGGESRQVEAHAEAVQRGRTRLGVRQQLEARRQVHDEPAAGWRLGTNPSSMGPTAGTWTSRSATSDARSSARCCSCRIASCARGCSGAASGSCSSRIVTV